MLKAVADHFVKAPHCGELISRILPLRQKSGMVGLFEGIY